MSLTIYQTPERCTEANIIIMEDFKALGSYHSGSHFTFGYEVFCRTTLHIIAGAPCISRINRMVPIK